MGFLSRKKVNNETTQNTTNNQTNVGIEDVDGIAIVGDGNTVTDHGAIDAALDAVSISHINALEFVGGGVDRVLDSNDDALRRVLESNDDAREDSFELVGGTVRRVLDSNDDARRDSFELVGGTIGRTLEVVDDVVEVLDDNTERVLDASADARRDSFNFGAGAVNASFAAIEAARQDAADARVEAFELTAGAFGTVIDEVRENTTLVTGAFESTLDTAVESARSEAARGTDKIMEVAMLAVLVVGLIAVFTKT